MNTRMLLLACTMLISLVLPGCWDYAEYEDFVQIIGMGMDYNNETQEITLTILYQPTEGKSSSQPSSATKSGGQQITHSATDKTFIGAATRLQEVVHKKLFYGYVKTVVISEEAAKYNMMDAIDLFDRSPSIHSSAYLAITSGKAADVIKTIDPYQTISSAEKIHDLIYFAPNTGLAYVVTINTFKEMLAIGGWEATVPHIIAIAAKSQKEETKSSIHEQLMLNEERTGAHRVSGLAAFKGDKFVGWLDEKESRGFSWITGKKIQYYTVSEPSSVGGTDEILYYAVTDSNNKINVQMENVTPVIYVDVKATAVLRKFSRDKSSEFLSLEEISIAEQKLADHIRSDVDAALNKGQKELQSDIFGFGFAVFRESPPLWKNEYEAKWTDIFPDIPVHITIDVSIPNTGTNIKRLLIK